MMMRLTADDVELQSLPAGIVLRRGTMALSAADTCMDGKLELHSLRRLQPVQLSEEWGDVVVHAENISRAAAFISDWNRLNWYCGMPTRVAIP